jgi:hypothetical protein
MVMVIVGLIYYKMVEVKVIKKGDSVHYVPSHKKESGEFENGVVKGIAPNGGVFVVYNCSGEWHRYEDYTGVNTRPEDLYEGWKF